MQNNKNHEEEVELRLKFEKKLNEQTKSLRDKKTKEKQLEDKLEAITTKYDE